MKTMILLLFSQILFFGCASNEAIDKLTVPNKKRDNQLTKYNFKAEILYQFYENFGFTDVCINYRVLYSLQANEFTKIKEKNKWKALPISKKDLEKINDITNKVDTVIVTNKYNVIYREKYIFADIRNEATEFVIKEDKCFINLMQGYYSFSDSSLTIYNKENNLLYHELYFCK
jgi:hypothetical protein